MDELLADQEREPGEREDDEQLHPRERAGVPHLAEGEGLVVEVAFEGLNASPRHKSGVAMRFPRFNRIRWDKPAAEAETLDGLKEFLSYSET